jgi:hypothetical protein
LLQQPMQATSPMLRVEQLVISLMLRAEGTMLVISPMPRVVPSGRPLCF